MLGDWGFERNIVLGVASSCIPSFRGLSTLLVVAISVLMGTVSVTGDGGGDCGDECGVGVELYLGVGVKLTVRAFGFLGSVGKNGLV